MELPIRLSASGEVVVVSVDPSATLAELHEICCAAAGVDPTYVALRDPNGRLLTDDSVAALASGEPLNLGWSPAHEARELLLARGVHLSEGAKPSELLYAAAQAGEVAALELLLSLRTLDVNEPARDGSTALHAAASKGETRCAELLLSHDNINVNARDAIDRTPLHAAAWDAMSECSHIDVMRLLLAAGASACAQTVRGFAPLHYTGLGKEEVELLVANGADVNATDRTLRTPLMNRAACGDAEGAQLLLSLGADPNKQQRDDGMTALHAAVYAGAPETVRVLLEGGADKSIAMKNGKTPLRFAMIYDQVECSYLLE